MTVSQPSSSPPVAPARRGVPPARLLMLGLGGLALLAGLAGGLALVGAPIAGGEAATTLAAGHGELMTLGFLGTVIALERAVALGRRWAYVAPLSTGLGALCLVAGQRPAAAAAFVAGGAALVAIYAVLSGRERTLHLGVQAAGAGAWVAAALLLAAGRPVSEVVPWLAAFLVMTVVGERLELARLGGLGVLVRRQFVVVTWLFVLGVSVAMVLPDAGARLAGVGLLGMAAWLAAHDLARRTVRLGSVTRYIAVCLLAGYAWLAVAGALWVAAGATNAGLLYDARLHALFLGFVMSMVFGHAPVIVPAVLRVPLPYRRWFYGHVALLHAGLLLRVGGDLLGLTAGWQLGAEVAVLALLAFVAASVAASATEIVARRRRVLPRPSRATA